MTVRLAAIAAVTVLCAGTLAGRQQAKPQDPQQPPRFRTEANFVRVDVYATQQQRPVLDLTREDFEVFEDGVPQRLSTFEHVQIRTGGPQDARIEPNTIQESRDALKNPRARVFVLFLDTLHTSVEGTWHSREAVIRLIGRMLGDDDLIGIMTPTMTPGEIVFARKTDVIERALREAAPWGTRHTLVEDDVERLFRTCFPYKEQEALVIELKRRRRERMTLDAMQDLVISLRDQREERKAIVTISEGWLLYTPNRQLMEPQRLRSGDLEPTPRAEPIGVGPDGRIRVGPRDAHAPLGDIQDCWAKRQALAAMDNQRLFKDMLDSANRANASFYTVDPRGLAVFDYPVGPEEPPGVITDANHLKNRTDNLRVLADNTDGLAVIGNNNLEPGLRRISDDLSSYYLLGYYSSNAKLDGRFRRLQVKIKRPGVDVRARRGYKAASAEELAKERTAVAAPAVPEATMKAQSALGALARLRPEAKLYSHAIAVRDGSVTVWFAGELAKPVASATTAAVSVSSGSAATSVEVPMVAGQRSFAGSLALQEAPAGPIDVRVRVAPRGEIPFTDGTRIDVVTGVALPMMFRRGPSTGNRYEPAGQPQFSRTERARFDVPRVGNLALTGVRVLDRNGNPVEVPATQSEREGWVSAEITLAALAPGDYLVELSGSVAGAEQKVLAAFRVTR